MITINMKKPIQCVSCPLWYVTTIREKLYDVCRIDYIVIENPYTLPDWCPIKDIPPHGDLIDREALNEAMARMVPWAIDDPTTNAYVEGLTAAYEEIQASPTIIPADVPDTNVGEKEET